MRRGRAHVAVMADARNVSRCNGRDFWQGRALLEPVVGVDHGRVSGYGGCLCWFVLVAWARATDVRGSWLYTVGDTHHR